jgi:hypothetical protein
MMTNNSFKSKKHALRLVVIASLSIIMSGCKVVGPEYTKPTIDVLTKRQVD